MFEIFYYEIIINTRYQRNTNVQQKPTRQIINYITHLSN